ncbi:MAG: sugar phosphate isomerase/epimerase [Chloroflexi bacterium]|nr:sugar phosphate isomerase/epimerase [Chloroflexota bacterium]
MKQWKLSVNAAFFGRQSNGYTQYQPQRTLEEKLALIKQVAGVEGVELKYPFDLEDVERARQLLAEHGLVCSAVNVDIKDAAYFRWGALSATSAEARDRAIRRLCEGMDIAAALGVNLVTTCPLADAYDYPFEIDYDQAWGWFIESVRRVAGHRDDVRLVMEYQPHYMEARTLLSDVGKMLYLIRQVDRPNFGANLDVGHAIFGGESPAEAAALLAREGRLWYLHSNDNIGRGGDWDMISGSVHFWEWLELLYTLDRLDYQGWIGADIAAHQLGPVEAFGANTRMLQRMMWLLDRVDIQELQALVRQDGTVPQIFDLLMRNMIQEAAR